MKLVVLSFIAVLLSGCGKNESAPLHTASPQPEVLGALTDYVAAHRGWSATDYRIEENRREGPLVVYTIVYRPDEKSRAPGSGKSFQIYYDTSKKVVVKELAFQ